MSRRFPLSTTPGIRFHQLSLFAVLAACLLLAGCGKSPVPSSPSDRNLAPPSSHKGPSKPSKPYVIAGKKYYPVASSVGWQEKGIASWYGPGFHGRLTANGERYSMYDQTAAHKLLPFNTILRVDNLDNGKHTLVRVNDRGPFVSGRIIDLSKKAAEDIGMVGPGVARVRITAVGGKGEETPATVVATADTEGGRDLPGTFYIQVGSYTIKSNAAAMLQKLAGRGYKGRLQHAVVGGKNFWRVQVGGYQGLSAVERVHRHIKSAFPSSFVIAD